MEQTPIIAGGARTTLSGKPMTKTDQRVKRKPEKLMILCSVMLAPLNRSPLGAVTNIIQEAKENANAYEEVAASLKRERLGWFNLFEYDVKEQAARDASKTSEEASITSVGSRKVVFESRRWAPLPAVGLSASSFGTNYVPVPQ
ncbi:hypothetical protein Tco_0838753 [Tanacetum coccineum]|uniref:Uncharacterized protein n=1 Tax=Tanacetum coccineum TaxID=301880 RepID=A0ABQ5ASL8_9ASTR